MDKADTEGKEGGEFFSSIYAQLTIDSNADVVLSSDEIKTALADKTLGSKVRRLFIKHESEWIKCPEWMGLKADLKEKSNLYQYAHAICSSR